MLIDLYSFDRASEPNTLINMKNLLNKQQENFKLVRESTSKMMSKGGGKPAGKASGLINNEK